ncbi:MAG: DUF4215 domain-containing protein [Myxococcota bacterium]|nr:DUF4215 domain-containing protein [Myxococcota bacterium]
MARWAYILVAMMVSACEPDDAPADQPMEAGGEMLPAGVMAEPDGPAIAGAAVFAGAPMIPRAAGEAMPPDDLPVPAPPGGMPDQADQADMNADISCESRADGDIVALGPPGECQYADPCAQTGTRTRTNQVCQNGAPTALEDTQTFVDCNRSTQGVVLETGEYGACQYAEPCDEEGTKSRTNRACDNGEPANQVETNPFPDCARDTDAMVMAEATVGACVYTDACTKVGTQTQTSTICQGGRAIEQEITAPSDACMRNTDGQVLMSGRFGACEYRDACIETGIRRRTNIVCSGGRIINADEESAEGCERETEGTVVAMGQFGECSGFDDVCDLDGSHVRTEQVCVEGLTIEQQVTAMCRRPATGVATQNNGVSACIDIEGGQLVLGDAQLTMPANAVADTTIITLQSDGRLEHRGYEAYSTTYRVDTSNAALSVAATLTVPFEGDPNRAVLYWKPEGERAFQRISGSANGSQYSALIDAAGVGFVGDGINFRPPPDRTCARLKTLDGRLADPGLVGVWLAVDDCHGEPHPSLSVDDFLVTENTIELLPTEPISLVERDGLTVFVTVLLNVTTSAQAYRLNLKAAVAAFAQSLVAERGIPAQLSIELFAGVDDTDPGNVIHSHTWQPHTMDLDAFTSRLQVFGTYQPPQPDQAHLHQALIETADKLEQAATAFRQRNRGGAFTLEYIVLFSDSADTANAVTTADTRAALDQKNTTVMTVGVTGPNYDATAMGEVSDDLVLPVDDQERLTREFLTLASRIETRVAGSYALAYCTPSRQENTDVTVALRASMNEQTATYAFDGRALVGCADSTDLIERCGDTTCGGLGCGICDDRVAGCNDSNACQNFCETHGPGTDIAIADRCTTPNPRGYVQYCEQSISTVCDGVCRDLTTDPFHCGMCGRECGEHTQGIVDGRPTDGVTCALGTCACLPGWHGPQCESTQCGDGVRTPDEQCDDGNDSNGDLCATTCQSLSTVQCDRQCDFQGTYHLEPSAQLAEPDGRDASPGDYFGYSVAISGDQTIVGAHEDDPLGVGSGSAYVFTRTDGRWTQTAKLTADDGGAGDRFGWSVAIDDGEAVIGARHADDLGVRSGAVYAVTHRDGAWTEQTKLLAVDGAANDEFGWSVAISEKTILVGAPGDGDGGNRSGAAYVFTRTDGVWIQSAKLTPRDGETNDHFGYSVALDGDVAVVGAYGEDASGLDSGAVYLFTRGDDGWTETSKLVAVDGAEDDWFGFSVSISGQTVLIGARNVDDQGQDDGAAYIFSLVDGSWTQTQRLLANGGSNQFGTTVAISDDFAIVGAGVGQPSYLFTRANGQWIQTTTLHPEEGGEAFRRAVDLAGDTALLGTTFVQWPAPRCTDDGDCFCRDGASGADCSERPSCGDETIQSAESCDDGNRIANDGCDARCQTEP